MPSIVVQARTPAASSSWTCESSLTATWWPSRLDGLAISVDPGRPLVPVRESGCGAAPAAAVDPRRREGRPVTLAALPPPEQPARAGRHPSPLTYVLGGLGVGGLAGFAYFGLTARRTPTSSARPRAGRPRPAVTIRVAPIRRKLLAADISLGIGLLARCGGVLLLQRSSGLRAARSAVQADIRLGLLSGGRVTLSAPF